MNSGAESRGSLGREVKEPAGRGQEEESLELQEKERPGSQVPGVLSMELVQQRREGADILFMQQAESITYRS